MSTKRGINPANRSMFASCIMNLPACKIMGWHFPDPSVSRIFFVALTAVSLSTGTTEASDASVNDVLV